MSSPAEPLPSRPLGKNPLRLGTLGFGGTALGNLYAAMTEEAAAQTLEAAHAAGVRYFDTAPLYGHGLSELRVGGALRRFRDADVRVSTKVGWRLRPAWGTPAGAGPYADVHAFTRIADYGYDGAMRSVEDSLQRLGVDRIDILLIHDADQRNHGDRFESVFRAAMNGAYRALEDLRRQKVVSAIGCGLNEWQACQQFAEAGDFDCFLLAGRYTLLEQGALESFLPLCERRGIGVIIGGPFNSGILAGGPRGLARFDYADAPAEVATRVAAIDAACRRHGVTLKAAALQFPLHHPCVASVIPGMRSAAEVAENVALLRTPVPVALWEDLRSEALIDPRAPTPGRALG